MWHALKSEGSGSRRIDGLRTLLLGTACAAAFIGGSAVAQTAPPQAAKAPAPRAAAADAEIQEIVITGTSIRGVAPVGAPVVGLDQEALQALPFATTAELIRNLPSIATLGAGDQFFGASNNSNANVTAGTGINLRGLGTEATLTLLNGRRLPPAGTQAQFFDPSIIPTLAIGRMEVMADGGSAIYGSDAVGGVVNMLLRRDYEGAETVVKYGGNGDSKQKIFGQVVGKRWEGGGLMVAYEYNKRDPLRASTRPLYTDDLRAFGGTDQRSFNSVPGNIQIGAVRYAIPDGQTGVGLRPTQLVANTANRQSAYLGIDAIPGQKRNSVVATADQRITDRLKGWVESYYAKRDVDRRVTAPNANITVPRANPFFVHPTNPAAASVVVNYSFYNDVGPNQQTAYQRANQVAGGFDFAVTDDWNLSAYASRGLNDESRTQRGINNAQLALALADTNPATALNVFGNGTANNAATLAKIMGYARIAAKYNLTDYGAKLDGPLFTMPGGQAKLAVGAEYQDHKIISIVEDTTSRADNQTVNRREPVVTRDVTSVYAETFVPFVGKANRMTGIEELSLSAALRYDEYSDFGSTTNPKLGLRYVPIEGLSLRGSYGKSFRAPTLSDIDSSTLTIAVQDFTDPSSRTGVTRTLWVRGGNAELTPERATIWSGGFDYKPSWLDDKVNLSLTYFNVNYKNRIETPGNDTLALTPARAAELGNLIIRNPSSALVLSYLNSPLFTGVQENPANILAFVDGRKLNVGLVKTDGLEANVSFRSETDVGTFDAALSGNYVMKFERARITSQPLLNVVDTINNPLRLRLRGSLGWSYEGFGATVFVNHAGDYLNNAVSPVQEVPSYTTVDLGLRYSFSVAGGSMLFDGLTVSLDVQNLLDDEPPPVLNGTLAFDPQVASIMGRYITVGLRKTW